MSNPVPGVAFATGFAQATGNLAGGSFTVANQVNAGDTLYVFIGERHPSGSPTVTGVSDSRGNAYTMLKATAGGAVVGSGLAKAVLATALQPGDTVSWTSSAATTNEYAGVGLSLPGACTEDGPVPAWKADANATAHPFTVTTPTDGDLVIGVDIESGGIGTPGSATVTNAIALAEYDGTNREIVAFYADPGPAGSLTPTVTWDTSHTGSMIALPVIVPAQQAAPAQGAWGLPL